MWGAAWLFKATKLPYYLDYIQQNIHNVKNFGEFGWDSKDAGNNLLVSKVYKHICLTVLLTLTIVSFQQLFFFYLFIFYAIVMFMIWLKMFFLLQ